MNDDNDERPRDLDLDAHRFVEKDEREEESVLVHVAGGTFISLTHSSATGASRKQRARQQLWRATRIFALLLAFIYIVQVTYCSSAGSSTACSWDLFPLVFPTLFSVGWFSIAAWFCVLFVLVAQRTSIWDCFVKYGYQYHMFDYKEETIVQRTTWTANQIAHEIRRSVGNNIARLADRTRWAFRFFQFVLMRFRLVLVTLLFCMGMILIGATVTFVALSSRVVIGIAIRFWLQFRFAVKPTIWLGCTILHF
jgi:hypothetical protein